MRKEEREKSNIKLSADGGMPRVSFTADDSAVATLTPEHYDIDGNDVTAFYDGAHKLVFVLDSTIYKDKPNVLLVINPMGDRKWDDILANDYNVDLETVRPKKDNKYQKLDIEYSGLAVYNKLINDYKTGDNLTDAIVALDVFRDESVRRAATDRLEISNDTIAKTRATILKTDEAIDELDRHMKTLRDKLKKQKKEVGKEPTKQSAAKILKTESQIDATNEKLRRAKRRLANAQRRMSNASEDVEVAMRILSQDKKTISPAKKTEVAIIEQEPKTEYAPQEKREENMADEVKPLFESDPEILDEKIAFKPIDFNSSQSVENKSAALAESSFNNWESAPSNPEQTAPAAAPVGNPEPVFAPISDVPPAPLSFTPPVIDAAPKTDWKEPIDVVPAYNPQPVVSSPAPAPRADEVPARNPYTPVTELPESISPSPEPSFVSRDPEPVVAPVTETARPVSPITGTATMTADGGKTKKPTLLYYMLLIALIVLSVLTLWLYQRNNPDTIPDLASTTPSVETPAPTPEPQPVPEVVESPFIQATLNEQPEPVAVPAPVPEQVVAQPEPIVEPEPEPAPAPEYDDYFHVDEPTDNASDVVAEPAPVPAPVIKPEYGTTSRHDNMFVAESEYEVPAPVPAAPTYAPDNYSAPAVAAAPGQPAMCDDGTAPDSYGCCAGEILMQVEGTSELGCCPLTGGQCFPPLK